MTSEPDRQDRVAELAGLIQRRCDLLGLSTRGVAEYVYGLKNTTVAEWLNGHNLEGHVIFLEFLEVLGIELRCLEIRVHKSEQSRPRETVID